MNRASRTSVRLAFLHGRVNDMGQSKGGNRTLYFWQGLACLSVVLIHCMLPTGLGVIA